MTGNGSPMEALRDLLEEMTRKIELLCCRCNAATQASAKATMSSVLPSSSFTSGEDPVSHISSEAFPPTAGTVPRNGLEEGKSSRHIENWLSQNCSLEEDVAVRRVGNLGGCSLGSKILKTSRPHYISDAKIGDAVASLLEDMKKTILAWSARYSSITTREDVEANSSRVVKYPCHDLYTNAQVMRQLGLTDEQDDLPPQGEEKVLPQMKERKRSASTRTPSSKRKKKYSFHEEAILANDKDKLELEDFTSTLDHQIYPLQVHTGFTSTSVPRLIIGPADLKPLNSALAMAVPASQDARIDVVESPDWLPKGWITELKLRCTGSTAGTRDRYFFDPVSKRRFRSKKEVFCFLETGKLGRYKSKSKIKAIKNFTTAEQSSPGPAMDLDEGKATSKEESSRVASSTAFSEGMPVSVGVSPVVVPAGGLNNVFMPYQAGQPSEWLMHESLGGLPLPRIIDHRLRFHECNLVKSTSSRNPASWPLIFGNAEGPRRPFVDTFDGGRAIENIRDNHGMHNMHFPTAEAWASAMGPKHARSTSKRILNSS